MYHHGAAMAATMRRQRERIRSAILGAAAWILAFEAR
jgi:hypothetical protein